MLNRHFCWEGVTQTGLFTGLQRGGWGGRGFKMLHNTEHSGSQKVKAQSRKTQSDAFSPVKKGDVALLWLDHVTDQTTSKRRIYSSITSVQKDHLRIISSQWLQKQVPVCTRGSYQFFCKYKSFRSISTCCTDTFIDNEASLIYLYLTSMEDPHS